MTSNITPEDIRGGFEMANEDVRAVEEELKGLGSKLRFQGMTGKDRADFLSSMTGDEFKRLKVLADALDVAGYQGGHTLEKLVGEAGGLVDLGGDVAQEDMSFDPTAPLDTTQIQDRRERLSPYKRLRREQARQNAAMFEDAIPQL